MKYWLFFLTAFLLADVKHTPTYAANPPSKSKFVHIVSKEAGIDFSTDKVLNITGSISSWNTIILEIVMARTTLTPGDRVVVLNSPGGSVDAGKDILDALLLERSVSGNKLICVVDGAAHSMAFNILSYCDVRLAREGSTSVVHKIRTFLLPSEPLTAKRAREIAKELDALDEPYRQQNAKKMGLSLKDYDKYADEETEWSAEKLLQMKYLHGLCTIERL